jgi:hypothetical protein
VDLARSTRPTRQRHEGGSLRKKAWCSVPRLENSGVVGLLFLAGFNSSSDIDSENDFGYRAAARPTFRPLHRTSGAAMPDPSSDLRILNGMEIETPCLVPWGEIDGTGPTRSCEICQKNVFDLIELTTAEAAQILAESDALPCVRICRAPDGEIVTADSPMGFRMRVWRALQRRSGWAASLFVVLFLPGCQTLLNSCFQYGTPVRTIKSSNLGKSTADDSARPKDDAARSTGPTD